MWFWTKKDCVKPSGPYQVKPTKGPVSFGVGWPSPTLPEKNWKLYISKLLHRFENEMAKSFFFLKSFAFSVDYFHYYLFLAAFTFHTTGAWTGKEGGISAWTKEVSEWCRLQDNQHHPQRWLFLEEGCCPRFVRHRANNLPWDISSVPIWQMTHSLEAFQLEKCVYHCQLNCDSPEQHPDSTVCV